MRGRKKKKSPRALFLTTRLQMLALLSTLIFEVQAHERLGSAGRRRKCFPIMSFITKSNDSFAMSRIPCAFLL